MDGEAIVTTLSRFSTTDATTNRTSLYKDITGSTLGAASYQLTTTAGSYSDTYTGSSEDDFSMLMAAFKPAVLNSGGGATTTTTLSYDNNGNLITYVSKWCQVLFFQLDLEEGCVMVTAPHFHLTEKAGLEKF